ncbi:nuclear transport factor 2 family protein [Jeotgalibacillus soli]|uniref:Steroid delta-isomerase n=1 Tax=Jeotgalibacillus soli TaxID=889306 RepID=A0A0C2VRY0_9BACL|nr:nuclear transport factor 2 family protein [Jeotgalibacillus soli]KIL47201.1 steroid delta-isomerase [Jeotgalibacillus soli]
MKGLAAELAQKQLDAYNNKDIREFLQVYSEEVEIMEFPSNKIMYTGIDKMRERYSNLFENNPNQHAELRARIAHDNIVIDHEFITGRANGIEVEAVAMYEVTNDKISKVWFIK